MGANTANKIGQSSKRRETTSPRPKESRDERNKRIREWRAKRRAAKLAAESSGPAAEVLTQESTPQAAPLDFQTANAAPVIPPAAPEAEAKPRRYRSPKADKAQAEATATQAVILLAMIDGFAVSVLGEEAARTPVERALTDEPLGRWLQRADPILLEAINKWSDPVCVLAGMTVWATRLYRIQSDKAEAEQRSQPVHGVPIEPAAPPRSSNGNRPTELTHVGPPSASPPPDLINLGGQEADE